MLSVIDDVSFSSTDFGGLDLEEELDTCSNGRHFSELDQIRTYHSPSKNDVWTEQDEDMVNSLLLKEIDFLTLPTLQQDSETLSTHATGNHPKCNNPSVYPTISTPNIPPTDHLSLQPLSWSWCWDDSVSSFPSGTSFCEGLTDNFDILSFTGSSVDGLLQQSGCANSSGRFEESEKSNDILKYEPVNSDGLFQEPKRLKEFQQPGKSSEQFQETVRSGEPALFANEALEQDKSFTRIKERNAETDCNSQSNSHGNIGTETCNSPSKSHGNIRTDTCNSLFKSHGNIGTDTCNSQFKSHGNIGTKTCNSQSKSHGNIGTETYNSQSKSHDNIDTDTESSAPNRQKRTRRDVNEPKRPKNGFIRYSVKHRAELSRRYPYKDNRSISKLLGIRWKKLTAEEKKPYEEEFSKDIHLIRSQNPLWRYAPAKKSAQELVDPMTSRLRPRDKIHSRIQELKDMEKDLDLPREGCDITGNVGRHSPLQNSATTWKQCDICSLWRPLPGHVDARDLPQTWSCFMNPDHRFNTCGTPSSLRPALPPPTPQFHHSVWPEVSPVTVQVRQSGSHHQSIVSNQCISLSHQSPLLLVYSTIPTLYAPTSNTTHAVIVNKSPAPF